MFRAPRRDSLDGHSRNNRRRRPGRRGDRARRLRVESLEDRRLLATLTVTTLIDENDGVALGGVSLRDALAAASAGDVIDFDPSLTAGGPASMVLTHGELRITRSLNVVGPGATLLTIDASGNDATPGVRLGDGSRVLAIDDSLANVSTVAVSGLTMTGGDSRLAGGAVFAAENLTLVDCTITGNASLSGLLAGGGGVYSYSRSPTPNSLSIVNSTISNNFTTAEGGGVRKRFGQLVVDGSTFSGNVADPAGGAISAAEGNISVQISNSTVTGNSTTGTGLFDGGGGVFLYRATATIADSTISGNTGHRGGGVYGYASDVDFTRTAFSENQAIYGGGIFGLGAVRLVDSVLRNNSAYFAGGAVYMSSQGSLAIDGSTVSGNSAASAGGISTYVDTVISNSTVDGNVARYGSGGGILGRQRQLTITNSSVRTNSAAGPGGGVAFFSSFDAPLTIEASVISGNSASFGSGGGVYARSQGAVTLGNSNLYGNTAASGFGGGLFAAANSVTVASSYINNNGASNGGGMYASSAAVVISDSAFSANSATGDGGGVATAFSNLTITRASIGFNTAASGGGGVAAFASELTIADSLVRFNSGARGGGVLVSGSLSTQIVRSSVVSNSAQTQGGGLHLTNTNWDLTNSTVSGNFASSSGGGIYASSTYSGEGAASHATITQNFAGTFGGGVAAVGTHVALSHAIVAGNQANFGTDLAPVFTSVSAEYSLVGDNANSGLAEAPVGSPDAQGNLIGGAGAGVIDARLAGLAETGGVVLRGGSRLQAHALLPESPALDAGNPAAVAGVDGVPLTDQRGAVFDRIVDGDGDGTPRIDLGAVESQTLRLVVDTLVDESDGDYSTGDLSLREALELTNGNRSVGNRVEFDPQLAGGTITLSRGALFISGALELVGLGSDLLTIDASGNDSTPEDDSGNGSYVLGVFTFDPVSITGLTLTGGDSFEAGGILSSAALTVADCTLSGNHALFGGGGIRQSGGSVHISNSRIIDNRSRYGGGGGLFATYGSIGSLTDSVVAGNSALAGGGGLNLLGAAFTLDRVVVEANSTEGNGGGVFSAMRELAISDSQINGNAAQAGGGVFAFSEVTVAKSTVSGNTSVGDGAGLRVDTLILHDSHVSSNYAGGAGGGAYVVGPAEIARSMVLYNTAAQGAGGGVAVFGNATVSGSTVAGNFAGLSGGGMDAHSAIELSSSTITSNSAGSGGGGVYADGGLMIARHSTVSHNSAGFGGGLFAAEGDLTLDHTIVAQNFASFGPDFTGFAGLNVAASHSLIGNNANTGLAASIAGAPDADGNLIGPTANTGPLTVIVEMAAMGDFEAGPGGDSFLFEYSVNGAAFEPLFVVSVDESRAQTYRMDNGVVRTLDDPLVVNGVVLTNDFRRFTTTIPGGVDLQIRFTAVNDGPTEAFAWRRLSIVTSTGITYGRAVQSVPTLDLFTAYEASPDYTIGGDMFGIRSRVEQGTPSLPFDIVDDSISIFTGDVQGIVGQFDSAPFFGVVDTVNGVGSDADSATWTFVAPITPIDPRLGPLTDNGGATWTRALLAGSLAIDAGSPTALAGQGLVPQFDQRGAPFTRVYNGAGTEGVTIDIGAVEFQPTVGSADFDASGVVDGFDFLAWQRSFGAVPPDGAADGGDADGDRDVDSFDFSLWERSFGSGLSPQMAVAAATGPAAPASLSAADVDAALALIQLTEAQSRPAYRPLARRR